VPDNTLLTAGEHMRTQHEVSRHFERLMDSAEVGPDVFKDLVVASSLRPALQLFYVSCSSVATKEFSVKPASL